LGSTVCCQNEIDLLKRKKHAFLNLGVISITFQSRLLREVQI
jgi:hypothetical protein